MASQEGRKRRSFLPAPKRTPGVSPTSPQAPGVPPTFPPPTFSSSIALLQSKSVSLPPSEIPTVAPTSEPCPLPSSQTSRQQSNPRQQKSDRCDSTRVDKVVEESAFGTGLRVGARVKIGGIKPGILRYLGTTHLAPGIFCGVELFEPAGNHDGEVNGHRYFVCAANYGIFAPKEKVCLDATSGLGRLAPDTDVCYSSTESLSERTQKAFKSFEEGELEAIDCSKLSPILSPQEDPAFVRKLKSSRLTSKANQLSAGSVELKLSSQSEDASEVSSKKAHSGLPRASKPTPPLSQSKLPTLSRTFRYTDGYAFSQHPAGISGLTSEVSTSSVDAAKIPVPDTGLDIDQDYDKSSPRFRTASTRSSEDSEEDGFLRDTLSTGIKKQLRADSRQYLNFTFDKDELIQSLDNEDNESDSGYQVRDSRSDSGYQVTDLSSTCYNPANLLYSDDQLMKHISGDFSADCFKDRSSKITEVSSSCPSGNFMRIETASVVLRADVPDLVTAAPPAIAVERHDALKSGSYIISGTDVTQSLDMNASSSGTEEDGLGLSVTQSISDSHIPADLLPHVDETKADVLLCNDDKKSEESKNDIDVLNQTRTIDSHTSENYIVWPEQDGAELSQSQSYTVCTHDHKDRRDSTKRERESSVVASHSYIISKSDSAASSPCRKYRKISTGSSANEGGDSSSSGTEPKTDSSGENKGDNLDDSSTGASPEVSQALEWDYGQEFDGKIPLAHQDNTMTTSTSTGTSESLSDVLRDMSDQSDGLFEGDTPLSLMEDSDQFEAPDNEFENIDSLEDFPIFGKDTVTVMTDSGISDKDFDFCPTKSSSSTVCGNSSDDCSREDDASSHATARAISSDSSQETLAAEYVADTPGSVEDKDFLSDDMCTTIRPDDTDGPSRKNSFGDGNSNSPASVVSMEDVSAGNDRTLVFDEEMSRDNDVDVSSHEDDVSSCAETGMVGTASPVHAASPDERNPAAEPENHMYSSNDSSAWNRRERPVSLVSTTSADTGYVPDSDSELGTLTTNSPNTGWVDRLGVSHPTSYAPLDIDGAFNPVPCSSEHKRSHSVTESPTSSTCLSHTVTKTSDDDDYNSDLAANTEDDRIEADQLYGPVAHDSSLAVVPCDMDTQEDRNQASINSSLQKDGVPDSNTSVEPTCSEMKETVDEIKEDKGPSKDASKEERKGRTRKPVMMTRRRSENIDHKLPNTNVVSRLADYIKSASPAKQKDVKENEPKKKMSKNTRNDIQKRTSIAEVTKGKPMLNSSRASSSDRTYNKGDSSIERAPVVKLDKPKPIIKRTAPKSKWGNIMLQIEAGKDSVKPKLKSEIKSSLAVYVNAHSTQNSPDAGNSTIPVNIAKAELGPSQQRRESKSKLKHLPPPPPKIDLSKVKSKLNVPTASSAIKTTPKREPSPGTADRLKTVLRTSRMSPARHAEPATVKETENSKRMSDGNIVLMMHRLTNGVNSAKTSRTDISVCDSTESILGSQNGGVPSKRSSVDHGKKDIHRVSSQSLQSERSDKLRSRKDLTSRSKKVHVNNGSTGAPAFTPIKMPSRAVEIKIGDGTAISSRGTSPAPVILKPIKPKPKSNSQTVAPTNNATWGTTNRTPSQHASALVKGRNFGGNKSKKTRTSSAATSNSSITPSVAQTEIIRLESLCEARTKELTHTKMQFRAAAQAFDAMTALVNYCCSDLNAFECPGLARKLDTVEKQLASCVSQIADLSCQRDTLEKDVKELTQEKTEALQKAEEAFNTINKEREEHARQTHEMDDTHNAALTTQRDELTSKHDETMKKVTEFYDRQIDMLRLAHERQITDAKNESKMEMNGVRISHLEEIQELRNKHDGQMEELHKQHRNKLEDITHRFEAIKLTLSEKVESLRIECDDLARRARSSEDALQRDADAKVQIALAPFLSLPKEIESLKTVLEMRNEEIQKLRTKNMDLEKQLEEVPIARDKIISLQQKVENLEAIIDIKTDHEKQLHEKCQVLMRKYDRESRANKRLSMDYEQVVWRMSQSSEFGSSESLTRRHFSRSPPCSEEGSPDSRYRALSPAAGGNSDVVMRVKKRSSHSISEGDRKLRSRSATFVLEKHESRDSHSPSSSPQLKHKRWRKKSQTDELAAAECNQQELLSNSVGEKEIAGQKDNSGAHLASGGEMVGSYTRSLSGVSDSGMYDSMTRSDVLDSSLVSLDSEWGTSVNLSFNCNSVMDEELCPVTGKYESSNDVTVVHLPQVSSDSDSGNVTVNSVRSGGSSQHPSSSDGQTEECRQASSCQVSITVALDASTADDSVFDERLHMGSS